MVMPSQGRVVVVNQGRVVDDHCCGLAPGVAQGQPVFQCLDPTGSECLVVATHRTPPSRADIVAV
jgi:hypothetical protein